MTPELDPTDPEPQEAPSPVANPEGRPPIVWWRDIPIFLILSTAVLFALTLAAIEDARESGTHARAGDTNVEVSATELAPLWIGVWVAVILIVMAITLMKDLANITPGIDPREEAARRSAFARFLIWTGAFTVLMMMAISAATVILGTSPQATHAHSYRLLLIFGIAGISFLMVFCWLRVFPHLLQPRATSGPQADISNWQLGLLYRSTADPALWVRQRLGLGYTLNRAHEDFWPTLISTLIVPIVVAASILIVL